MLEPVQARFDAAFEPVAANAGGPVGLGVSGGSDSLALLVLAAQSSVVSNADLIAFTVDHRLRDEAAKEAEFVADICARLGIAHTTLVWDAPQKSQAKARRARHGLLARAIKDHGGRVIVLAHTRDDQTETSYIRSGGGHIPGGEPAPNATDYGLAGMRALAVSPVWPHGEDVFISRPLLDVSRTDLQTFLKTRAQNWVRDPSNNDEAYTRIRVRRELAEDAELAAQITAKQTRCFDERAVTDDAIATWLSSARQDDAAIILAKPNLKDSTVAIGLAIACACVAGTDRLARHDRQMFAVRALMTETQSLTLGGAHIISNRKGWVFVRETNRPEQEQPTNALRRLRNHVAILRGHLP